jgi:hypothetical protein
MEHPDCIAAKGNENRSLSGDLPEVAKANDTGKSDSDSFFHMLLEGAIACYRAIWSSRRRGIETPFLGRQA